MALETADRKQKAVLWPFAGSDRDGQPTVTAGGEVSVRWENKQKESVDSRGNTIRIDATVVVGEVIAVGSIMWEGEQKDLPAAVASYSDLMQVVGLGTIPDVKARNTRRVVLLQKYNDTLPTVV